MLNSWNRKWDWSKGKQSVATALLSVSVGRLVRRVVIESRIPGDGADSVAAVSLHQRIRDQHVPDEYGCSPGRPGLKSFAACPVAIPSP